MAKTKAQLNREIAASLARARTKRFAPGDPNNDDFLRHLDDFNDPPRTALHRAAKTDRSHATRKATSKSAQRHDDSDLKRTRHHSTVKAAPRRKLGSTGDVNPIDYGGGFIYSSPESGGPWVEYFNGLDSEEGMSGEFDEDKIAKHKVTLYRVDLEKDGPAFLRQYDWVKWGDVAESAGQDPEKYSASHLKTAQQRSNALADAAGYSGWHAFDSYPLELTIAELRKRWGVRK